MNSNITVENDKGNLIVNYNLQRCKKCILSCEFPNISFNQDGVCNYCLAPEGILVSSDEIKKANSHIFKLIKSAHNRQYDCLALYSGGKDSSYALYVIKKVLKLNPLALTIDNGFIADLVLPNMKLVLDNLDIDHIIFKPSKHYMQSIYVSAINITEIVPENIMYATSACGGCIATVLSIGSREAISRNIPLMMGGWTPGQLTRSPLLQGSFLEKICTQHFSKIELSTFEVKEKIDLYKPKDSDFPPLFNPLYSIPYNEKEVIRKLNDLGWKKPKDTDSCSSNCRLNSFLVIDHIKKYGFHPYEYELSFHVRNGLSSRKEAMEKITNLSCNGILLNTIANELGIQNTLF
jgi:tRNA(Ile)-lysidine synthase TilS/MesJ